MKDKAHLSMLANLSADTVTCKRNLQTGKTILESGDKITVSGDTLTFKPYGYAVTEEL